MSDPESMPARSPKPRWREWLSLAVAAVAAVSVGLYFFLGSSGDGVDPPAGPVDTVLAVFRAIEAGDRDAVDALLDTEFRNDAEFVLVPFGPIGNTLRAKPAVQGLKTIEVANQAGWASVAVSGTVDESGFPREVEGTVYLKQVDGRWRISDERTFFTANGGTRPPAPPTADGLGVLEPNRPKIGEAAPDFALIDARDGVTVRRLSEFRGKAVVLNWYASWCGPCKREIPAFQDAAEALADQVVFLGVNLEESQSQAAGVLDVFKAKYPALLDSNGAVGDHYRVKYMPTTFFIDEDGILRAQQTGELTESALVEKLGTVGVTYAP